MGNSSSKTGDSAANPPKTTASKSFDWGKVPDGPPAAEKDPRELVLQSWASCKSKPNEAKLFRSDTEEKARREGLGWRKRTSFIELDCGDDSFFVSNTSKAVAVADGVGGWKDEGVDPSVFPNELMRNAKLYSETHRDELDPEVIMNNAFAKTENDNIVAAGSSTVCIATLSTDVSGTFLDVANLGDSGCIVIREQEIIHRVHEKVHGFNAPFQLSLLPKRYLGRCFADKMDDSIRERIEVREGDVIVLGSDGLFDNKFCSAIGTDAGWLGNHKRDPYEAIPLVGPILKMAMGKDVKVEYTDPYRVVQRLVAESYKVSLNKEAVTPWSQALASFGVAEHQGGKVDDITVLVSRVATRDVATRMTMW
jgi:protein phosphatase PTC7